MRLRKMIETLTGVVDLQDLFVFGGLACVGYGVAQIYAPAAWIVIGAALFWLGVKTMKG